MTIPLRHRATRTRNAQYVNYEFVSLADSSPAARCNDREFGTSHSKAALDKVHRFPRRRKGGKAAADEIPESAIA
jgi:hypothetical protein